MGKKTESAIPNAAKFMREVIRGSTYTFATAIADLVDNSIGAGADEVSIWVDYSNLEVILLDNGVGMSDETHKESMKIAAETREYKKDDLGKYGTGMKAASLSQASRVIVATKADAKANITVRCLDLEHIEETNNWDKLTLLLKPGDLPERAVKHLADKTGTAVIWQNLDRLGFEAGEDPEKKVIELKDQTKLAEDHLSMVFHRFIAGSTRSGQLTKITINGHPVKPWDPFVRSEKTVKVAELVVPLKGSQVTLTGYVLPTEKEFSSKAAFVAAAGAKRWNESQGFYVYRNDRLIRSGGWLRMRANEEHVKYARLSIDFDSDLDDIFQVNVAKSHIVLPQNIKIRFEPTVKAVTSQAQKRYREKLVPVRVAHLPGREISSDRGMSRRMTATALAGLLEKVAATASLNDELTVLKESLRRENPEVAKEIGW